MLMVEDLINKLLDKKSPPSKIVLASAANALGDMHNEYINTYNQWITIAIEYNKLKETHESLKEKFNELLDRFVAMSECITKLEIKIDEIRRKNQTY
jgi:FtsZ-binding cell division protein ZapB